MYEDLRYDSNRNAALLSNMLSRHPDVGDGAGSEIAAQDYLGGPVGTSRVEKGLGQGRITLYFRPPNAVMLFNGMDGFADGTADSVAYSNPGVDLAGVRWHPIFLFRAQLVMGMLDAGGLQGVTNLQLAGHSAGGATAIIVHYLLRQDNPDLFMRTMTFGSPRVGNFQADRAMANERVCRFFFDNDPVPFAPPRFGEAPISYVVLPNPVTTPWGGWKQIGIGKEINANPNPEFTPMPRGVLPIRDINLASWMLGASFLYNWRHEINAYASELAIFAPPLAQGVREIPPAGPERRRENNPDPIIVEPRLTQADKDRMQREMQQRQSQLAGDSWKFYAKRSTSGYGVYWTDILCAVCTTRKKAQVMASGLNRAARQWDNAPTGSLEALDFAIRQVFLP